MKSNNNKQGQPISRYHIIDLFDKTVKKKFNLYNGLFLDLPYQNVENIGTLIPVLQQETKKGLDEGKDPQQIIEDFFENQTAAKTEQDRIDFMFRVIQYVERQIVLFDSVEDSAMPFIRESEHEISIRDLINRLENEHDTATIKEKLAQFSTRIVFTAHPTQFYPTRVLDIIRRLRNYLHVNDIENIDITLQQLGLTSLLNSEKPTPLEEARNIVYFLRNVYYDAAAKLYARLKDALNDDSFENPDIVRLGFWPGGDRDGNPFVTYKTTMDVADELRISLMKCYYNDVKLLSEKLTFRGIEEITGQLRDTLYIAMFDASISLKQHEILDPLYQIKELQQKHYNNLYLHETNTLIDKVKIFKTHFATLDIRQNHIVHQHVVEAILKDNNLIEESITDLSEEKIVSLLLHENPEVKAEHFEDELIKDTILNIQQLPEIQSKNGEEGCNRYVISHAEDMYSILYVFALLRWCGWQNGNIPMDIVPLFESVTGMDNSDSIMRKLYEIPAYRYHLQNRNNKQTIMLGFSDGTKDGGYLKANWSIFTTKEKLSELSDNYGLQAIFFDGRGGPPARGGGKTHRFYAAQSDKIASNEIQLTIQGQTISSKYGTQAHFIHNCEQLVTAGLSNIFYGKKNTISEDERNLIDELADISYEKYTSLKNHEKFIPYLEKRSTLRFYGQTNIGSRPSKRGKSEKLNLDDLRAIPYVGSWSQLKQNVPGFFGIGTALHKAVEQGKEQQLKDLFCHVAFFKALLLNSMMALTKCYFELTTYLEKDDEFSDFWKILRDEYQLSVEMLLRVSGYDQLMQEEPVSLNSVRIREKIVLPLLIIQQYALQKIEHNSDLKDVYEKIVVRSLYGNINASRNSA